MNLEDILSQSKFLLPTKKPIGKSFLEFLQGLFSEYVTTLKDNSGFLEDCAEWVMDEDQYIERVESTCSRITNVIRAKNGIEQHTAYTLFKKLMDELCYFLYKPDFITTNIKPSEAFFRCVYLAPEGATTVHPVQEQHFLFHRPFEIRDDTPPSRFSPSRVASLYLTNALAVGFVECRSENMINFQGAKFEARNNLRVLNFDFTLPAPLEKVSDLGKYQLNIQYKGLILPLYIACFTLYEGTARDPEEYVIPQFITAWNHSGEYFFGIRYPSTKTWNDHYKGRFYNLILPTKSEKNEGYCDWLQKVFNMSPVCSWHHHQKDIEEFYTNTYSAATAPINLEVEAIEWPINANLSAPHDLTDFGKMEFYMRNNLNTSPISFSSTPSSI